MLEKTKRFGHALIALTKADSGTAKLINELTQENAKLKAESAKAKADLKRVRARMKRMVEALQSSTEDLLEPAQSKAQSPKLSLRQSPPKNNNLDLPTSAVTRP